MPPLGMAGVSFFGASATIASVVIIRPAIDAASGIVTSTVFTDQYFRFVGAGFNKVNGLGIRSRTASAPILARCDDAHRALRAAAMDTWRNAAAAA